MMDSFDCLLENAKVLKKEKCSGIVRLAITIEMTLGCMMPKRRKVLWDYLCKSRKVMGNKIFEDEMDLAELLIKRGLGGGIIGDE